MCRETAIKEAGKTMYIIPKHQMAIWYYIYICILGPCLCTYFILFGICLLYLHLEHISTSIYNIYYIYVYVCRKKINFLSFYSKRKYRAITTEAPHTQTEYILSSLYSIHYTAHMAPKVSMS